MAEIIPYLNGDVCLVTGVASYRISLDEVVAINRPVSSGLLKPEYSFSVIYANNQRITVYSIDAEESAGSHEVLMAHWESFNRHNNLYENSSEVPVTYALSGYRIQVTWGGNTVIVYLKDLAGIKLVSKGLVVHYHGKAPTTFQSENPAYLTRLQNGLEKHLREVVFV